MFRTSIKLLVFVILIVGIASICPVWASDDDPNPIYPVKVNGKIGFIDKTGKIVIEPQFDFYSVGEFSEGLARASINKKVVPEGNIPYEEIRWGFIDKTGKWIIPPQFVRAEDFSEGLAGVWVPGRDKIASCGYIDKSGKFIIEPQFMWGDNFEKGVTIVATSSENKHILINKTGEKLTRKEYEYISPLVDDRAIVTLTNWATRAPIFGFIDRKGNEITKVNFAPGVHDFSEGLACVNAGHWEWKTYDFMEPTNPIDALIFSHWVPFGKYGYIDKSGKFAIRPQFKDARDFSEGLAPVAIVEDDHEKWGYVNKTGEFVIKPQFVRARRFSEGLAGVEVLKNDKLKAGYIDKTGKIVIEPQFNEVLNFSEGFAAVSLGEFSDEKWGYIDRNGNPVCKIEFDGVEDFTDGLGIIEVEEIGGSYLYGLIDSHGNVIMKPISHIRPIFKYGIAQVETGNYDNRKVGYIDQKGNYIWNPSN
jgi:hypothetical protein